MAEYVLGVDGGASKTDYLLFDMDGNIKAHLRGPTTSHDSFAGGMAELEQHLNGILRPLLAENGLEPQGIAAAVFGMSGVDMPSEQAAIEAIFARMGFRSFRVMNDSFIGIKAGSRRGYGICVVNGSGNTVGGIDRAGRWLQIGGMGFVSCEDGGSGGYCAKALRAVYEELLCLGTPTAMTQPILGLLGVDDPACFIQAVVERYDTHIVSRRAILDVLFACANNGDEVAAGILKQVGAQMARCIAGCARRLDMGEEFDVVLVGSVTLKATCPIMLDTLKAETLRLSGKRVHFIPLKVTVAVGSVLWAMELTQGSLVDDATVDRVIAAVSGAADML
jgi:N-acetylglucosamine kinase-like BadF-type ATPase